jgi:hypothetical protein
MAAVGVFIIEVGGILQIDEVHDPRQVSPGCFQKEMVMVLHEAIDMDDDAEALVRFPQAVQEKVSVIVRDEYGLLSISP